jgi:hypothetical protein
VFSTSGGGETLFLVVSISGVKTLGSAFSGHTWQWRVSNRLLVEDIVWSLELLQGQNPGFNWLDRTMTMFMHCCLPAGVVLENLVRSLGTITIVGALAVVGRVFILFFLLLLLLFWLCASLMSRLVFSYYVVAESCV